MKKHECRDCQQEFTVDGPGRPHSRCPECRDKEELKATEAIRPSITGKELVDRLELNLKAAGLHISQWRDKYE